MTFLPILKAVDSIETVKAKEFVRRLCLPGQSRSFASALVWPMEPGASQKRLMHHVQCITCCPVSRPFDFTAPLTSLHLSDLS